MTTFSVKTTGRNKYDFFDYDLQVGESLAFKPDDITKIRKARIMLVNAVTVHRNYRGLEWGISSTIDYNNDLVILTRVS